MQKDDYERFVDQKIADYKHNMELAYKDYTQAKVAYQAALLQKETYINLTKDGKL